MILRCRLATIQSLAPCLAVRSFEMLYCHHADFAFDFLFLSGHEVTCRRCACVRRRRDDHHSRTRTRTRGSTNPHRIYLSHSLTQPRTMSSQGPSHPPPPPPSEGSHTNLNTAPQSFLNPFKASGGARRGHDPLKPPTAAERATYLRRITRPDLPEPKPTRFQRGMGVLAVVSSVAAGIYMTFFMDWHRDQHAFKEVSASAAR